MGNFFGKVVYKFRRFLARKPHAVLCSKIDKTSSVGNGAQVVCSSIGKYSYVYNSRLLYTDLGAFCSIAECCVIGGAKHPLDYVSTSPAFYNGGNVLHKHFSKFNFDEYVRTVIGNDVWIGSSCLIKGGIKIGDGAVVGMGSVVTHDIPPFEIWAGNPAKKIKDRFDEDTKQKLIELKWWNWDNKKIKKYSAWFDDPQKLFLELENEK